MNITVRKVGGSASIVIPRPIARQMNITPGTKMEIRITPDTITLYKLPRRSLAAPGEVVGGPKEPKPKVVKPRGRPRLTPRVNETKSE